MANIIGRIGNVLYIHLEDIETITEAVLMDEGALILGSFNEYSNIYFVELEIYGVSQHDEIEPVTESDREAMI